MTGAPNPSDRAAQALRQVRERYADRYAAARAHRAAGGRVVGYVGADVPVELIRAVGALPLRLAADPLADPARGAAYLAGAIDPPVVHLLSDLLHGHAPVDLLLISHDCEASLHLFYAIREMRRLGIEPLLPPTHLVDMLHLPHSSTIRYNLVRLRELASRLERWAGAPIDGPALGEAVAVQNDLRAAARRLAALRGPGRTVLTGADALALHGAGTAMPAAEYVPLVTTVVDAADALPPVERPRLFLTGSPHDGDHVYRALEADGYTVVGETHDWGAGMYGPDVADASFEALAESYTRTRPTHAGSPRDQADGAARGARDAGADALVCYARTHDDAPLWDFPAQAAATGLPSVRVTGQPYGGIDLTAVRAGLTLEGERTRA